MAEAVSVEAGIRYVNPEWRDADETPQIGSGDSRRANTSVFGVKITDARAADEGFGLETSGFELTTHATTSACADDEVLRRSYRSEMCELVQQISGASQTIALGHLVRTEDQSDFNTAYARFVHCDYNTANLDFMSHALLNKRGIEPDGSWSYAWYNTWQPFDHVAHHNPLAMLDVRSLDERDIIDYRYTGYEDQPDAGGLVAAPVYNPDHRWFFYPEMTPGEVLLSKQNDGRPGYVRQCPHTSFLNPLAPADAPPRRSVETRILAIFEPA